MLIIQVDVDGCFRLSVILIYIVYISSTGALFKRFGLIRIKLYCHPQVDGNSI